MLQALLRMALPTTAAHGCAAAAALASAATTLASE
jgi:hypothetical protein